MTTATKKLKTPKSNAKTTKRMIYYIRAVSAKNQPFDLQTTLAAVLSKRSTINSTQVTVPSPESDGRVIRIQERKKDPEASDLNGVYLHILSYIPGIKASTVTPNVNGMKDSFVFQDAGQGREFKDKECFLRISGADVIFCSNGLSLQKVRSFLLTLLNDSVTDNSKLVTFELSKTVDASVVEYLTKNGVKSIEFNANAFALDVEGFEEQAKDENMFVSSCKSMVRGLRASIEVDDTKEEQIIKENLIVSVGLNLNGNTRAPIETRDFIHSMAVELLNDDDDEDGFMTITDSKGKRIKSSQVVYSNKVSIKKLENSLEPNSVWGQLRKYYRDLSDSNVIES